MMEANREATMIQTKLFSFFFRKKKNSRLRKFIDKYIKRISFINLLHLINNFSFSNCLLNVKDFIFNNNNKKTLLPLLLINDDFIIFDNVLGNLNLFLDSDDWIVTFILSYLWLAAILYLNKDFPKDGDDSDKIVFFFFRKKKNSRLRKFIDKYIKRISFINLLHLINNFSFSNCLLNVKIYYHFLLLKIKSFTFNNKK